MTPLDVAVIGCGTAGAAAALFLARAGHRVTVFEAVEDPGPVGAGIMVQPTGMRVLARLGLLEPILARASRVERLHCVNAAGRTVIDLRYGDLHPRAFGVGLHRGVLFAELFGTVRREPGIDLRCGHPIEDLRADGARRWVVEKDGDEHGPFDLVVVADGARSQLRDDAPLTHREARYPWGALWFIGDDPDQDFDKVLYQVVRSTTEMLGLLPSGLGPTGDTPKVSMFWSLPVEGVDAWRKKGLGPWKDHLRALEPRSAPVLDQIDSIDEVLFATYWDIVLHPWNTDAVVFLGDAAHATSPQLGQGANLALVDAMYLARALASDAPSVSEALVAYSRSREAHLGYYQWATRFLTPFFQSDRGALAIPRDLFMGTVCKLPYVRTRMIRTMCGLERGVVLPDPLPLPDLFTGAADEGPALGVYRTGS
ncbi:MAG: FAD-dependent monooxygenase [Sandaracinaceae bacterium]|nr:FAD-dependent monooxygenase [Sandaracinaceae bacterium]